MNTLSNVKQNLQSIAKNYLNALLMCFMLLCLRKAAGVTWQAPNNIRGKSVKADIGINAPFAEKRINF